MTPMPWHNPPLLSPRLPPRAESRSRGRFASLALGQITLQVQRLFSFYLFAGESKSKKRKNSFWCSRAVMFMLKYSNEERFCQKTLNISKKKKSPKKICLLVGGERKLQMSASRYLVDADQRLSDCFISRACEPTQITTDRHLKRISLLDVLLQEVHEIPPTKTVGTNPHRSSSRMQLLGAIKETFFKPWIFLKDFQKVILRLITR